MSTAPPAGHRAIARLRSEYLDPFLGSDPGLNRLRGAVQAAVTIAAAISVERWFVVTTHALQQPVGPGTPAAVLEANHLHLVVALLLGAMVGMVSTLTVADASARAQLNHMLLIPIPMVPALTIGALLGGHHTVSLVWLTVLMGAGTWLRKFGPWGTTAGTVLFFGDFLGFFLRGSLPARDLGWLIAELLVGVAVATVVRFTLFCPRPRRALVRTQRSYAARARRLAAIAVETFDDPRREAHLQRQLVRLNEAALMIDAQLADPASLPAGAAPRVLHERLFDLELSLSNLARLAAKLGRLPVAESRRRSIRAALVAVAGDDLPTARLHAQELIASVQPIPAAPTSDAEAQVAVLAYRFADSVRMLAEAMTEWLQVAETDAGPDAFEPAATLSGGWLPGSATVAATASAQPARPGEGIALSAHSRAAIQMTLAVGGAVVAGSALSTQRYYWAVIAAFITFTGANTSGEQVRKALWRVLGTLIGVVIGSVAVDAVGENTYASIVVILAALFVGIYLMRISYAFLVVGITVTVSQLYLDLGEFSDSLLLLRLAETTIGAAVAIAVVVLVLPLRTHRVVRLALRRHVEAIGMLVRDTGQVLTAGADGATIRPGARRIDAAYQELLATARPVRRSVFGSLDQQTATMLHHASAARHFARNLALDLRGCGAAAPTDDASVQAAITCMLGSIEVLAAALSAAPDRPYVRAAALLCRAENARRDASGVFAQQRLALADLRLLDGSLAELAATLAVPVTEQDLTTPITHPSRTAL
ncbi:MAG TPA: FUSC family protein [Sporichthyaceae bacterium]|nr:FUSC family protein [Sporichthyaceae bacterium]